MAAIWPMLAVAAPPAQKANFDDLARRAAAALDTRPAEAAALYEQALALRPGWAEGWMNRGAALYQMGRFGEARDALRKCVALAPGRGTPRAFLGMAEYDLGEYGPALADILQGESIGLADQPAFLAAVHYHGALIYLRAADYARALEQIRPLARYGVELAGAVEALGLSVLNLRFLPETLPPDRRPLVDLAGRAAWAFLGERPQESGPLFEQLAEQFPDEPGVHYMEGVFLMDHNAAAAEEEFRKELRIAPAHVLARVQLAILLSKDGDAASAVQLAGEAVKLAPSEALCHVTLGRALLDAGRNAEAIAALEKGLKLAPRAARTHFYLAQAYRRAGRDADARKESAEWDRLHAEQEPVELNAGPKP
jgi:tetratricopeptide (TPR) repeat protein